MSQPRHARADGTDGRWGRAHRTWGQRAVLTIGIFVVVLMLSGASVVGYALVKYESIERVEGLELDAAPPGEPKNFLIVGADDRPGTDGKRTDTIMVLRVIPAEEQAMLLSFPRDLMVPIAGTGRTAMINSAFQMENGEKVLSDTIRENFAIKVHHYVELDFQAFKQLVDSVGGVNLYFDRPVRDQASGLHVYDTGCVTLDGQAALGYVRSRKLQYMEDGRWVKDPRASDLTRVERQQLFVRRALATTLQQLKSNPGKLTSMVEIGVDNVRLDESLGLSDVLELAKQFEDISTGALQTHLLPVLAHPDDPNRVIVDKRKAAPILNHFRGLDPSDIGPELVEVTVLNGTDTDGFARDASGAFAAVGFDVQNPGDVPEDERPERTTVRHGSGGRDYGMRVLRHITGGAALVEDATLDEHEVTVVLGDDFTTVHEQPTPLDKLPAAPGVGDAPGDGASDGAETTTTTTSTTTTTVPTSPPTTSHIAIIGEPPEGTSC